MGRCGTNLLERTNALNFVAGMNDGRRPTLGAHEHNVHQLWCRGHGLHAFKVVNGHLSLQGMKKGGGRRTRRDATRGAEEAGEKEATTTKKKR